MIQMEVVVRFRTADAQREMRGEGQAFVGSVRRRAVSIAQRNAPRRSGQYAASIQERGEGVYAAVEYAGVLERAREVLQRAVQEAVADAGGIARGMGGGG